MMKFFTNLFSSGNRTENEPIFPDLSKIISEIRKVEESEKIPLGKKIYDFQYGDLQVRFDRDITHNGRICILRGKERLYSFTVFAKEGEYDILQDALKSAIEFLKSDQSIKNLPDSDVLKGFYHHH